MKSLKDKKKKGDKETFELPTEVDFSQGIRGRFYRPKKISTTIRLDDDVLTFFRRIASQKKTGYQSLVNEILREYKNKAESDCLKVSS
jgi:uncharacterized protein (DUF4415 family)